MGGLPLAALSIQFSKIVFALLSAFTNQSIYSDTNLNDNLKFEKPEIFYKEKVRPRAFQVNPYNFLTEGLQAGLRIPLPRTNN